MSHQGVLTINRNRCSTKSYHVHGFRPICYALTDMLFGDIFFYFLEYLFRVTVRMIRRRASDTWPVAKAFVTGSIFPKGGPGCYVAEVDYIYRVGDERFRGTNKKPFIFHVSGEIYIKDFVTGKEFTVRVKPGDPTVSIVA